jgi:hypothetical protein
VPPFSRPSAPLSPPSPLQDEYLDSRTLEQRLHEVAKKFVRPGQPLQQARPQQQTQQQPPANGLQPSQQPQGQFQMQGMHQPMQAPQYPNGAVQGGGGPGAYAQGGGPAPNGMMPEHMRGQMQPMQGHGMVQPKLEPGQAMMGPGAQPFNPAGPPGGVMSNGAPVLIRGQRDWPGAGPQPMMSVRATRRPSLQCTRADPPST